MPKNKHITRYIDYKTYITSDVWKEKAARLKRGASCQDCKSKSWLVVHHKTYKRLGRERRDDLIVLCQPCHDHLHNTHRYSPLQRRYIAKPKSITGQGYSSIEI